MKLDVKNNWEYFTYSFDGKRIDENSKGKVILMNGDIVNYKPVKTVGRYSDHGNIYEVVRPELFATIRYNAQFIDVKLEDLQIKEFINY